VEKFPCNKLILKILFKREVKISEQPSRIKLRVSSRPTQFDGLTRRICLLKVRRSEWKSKEHLKITESEASFGIATEEKELKIEKKRYLQKFQ
jgi:hypothetical protein